MKLIIDITEAECLDDGEDYIDTYKDYKDTRKPNREGLYRCTLCGQYKPKSDFYKDRRVPCGIRNRCKKCYHKKGR